MSSNSASGESQDLRRRVDEMHSPLVRFAKAMLSRVYKWEHKPTPDEVKNHRRLVNFRKRTQKLKMG